MRNTCHIARSELSRLFYSPIAWILLAIFSFQSGLAFVDELRIQWSALNTGSPPAWPLTASIFAERPRSLITTMNDAVYLYIPLLTMGVFSREYSAGSFSLLLSSPIRIVEIVIGKYLSLFCYGLLLASVLVYVMCVGGLYIEHLDYGWVLSGVLGNFLIICMYAAIGVFISSLSRYQVVSALGTLAVLAFLQYSPSIMMRYPELSEYAFSLTPLLAKMDFQGGLISSKNVVTFLAIAGLFLAFTVVHLSAVRANRGSRQRSFGYAIAVAILVMIMAVASKPSNVRYWDVTRVQSQTLAEASQEIMAEVRGPWKLTTFMNIADWWAFTPAIASHDYQLWLRNTLTRVNPEVSLELLLYYEMSANDELRQEYPDLSDEQIAQALAEKHDFDVDHILSPEDVAVIVPFQPGRFIDFQLLEWNGKSEVLRSFRNDITNYWTVEKEIMAAFQRMLVGPTRLAMVHGERRVGIPEVTAYDHIATDFSHRGSLVNNGFEVSSVALDAPISSDVDVLVIAGPTKEFSDAELANLRIYIESGRNLLVSSEPGCHDIINPILNLVGVTFPAQQVFQTHRKPATESFASDVVFAEYSRAAAELGFRYPDSLRLEPLVLKGTGRLIHEDRSGFGSQVLLQSNGNRAWHEEYVDRSLLGQDAEFDERTNRKSTDDLALALTREINGRAQRIAVIADADFMSDSITTDISRYFRHLDFIHDLFHWLSDSTYPINTDRLEFPDKRVSADYSDFVRLGILLKGVVPGMLVLLGYLLLNRRRSN